MHSSPVPSIEQVKREAQAAVALHDDVNAACPYPFGSTEGQVFRDEFVWIRSVLNAKLTAGGGKAVSP